MPIVAVRHMVQSLSKMIEHKASIGDFSSPLSNDHRAESSCARRMECGRTSACLIQIKF